MTKLTVAFAFASVLMLAGCSSMSRKVSESRELATSEPEEQRVAQIERAEQAASNTEKEFQEVVWVDLHMQLPATWVIKADKGESFEAENPASGESVSITAMMPPAEFMAASPSPQEILSKYVEIDAQPYPDASETLIVLPHRLFQLPCGEPAAVVVESIGGNEFMIGYSVASNDKMYGVHFYRVGTPVDMLGRYQEMIDTTSIHGFVGSKCSGKE